MSPNRHPRVRPALLPREPLHGGQGAGRIEKATHVVTVDGASADFAIRVPFRVSGVELDPAYEILRWTPEYRAAADSVHSMASGR